jgi:hypothetical protein
MKKLLLGIVLLAALVGISYLKTTMESERAAEAFIDGHQVGTRAAQSAQPDVDSMSGAFEKERLALVEQKTALADSLAARDQQHERVVDSLTDKLAGQDSEISRLKKQASAGPPPSKAKTPRKTSTAQATESQIVSHYKLAVAKLPSDLSAYEYRVALAEVKTETAEKFKITANHLDQIREEYNLD